MASKAGQWPTPSAVSYGTNQGGAAGRTGPVRASLETLAKQWPTATSKDAAATSKDAAASGAQNYSTASGRHSGTTLTDAAVRNPLWATPRQVDATRGAGESTKREGGPSLLTQAQDLWATPAARDWRSEVATQSPSIAPPLGRQVLRTPTDGAECPRRLNPLFVEWLMGLPFDWTDFEPSATAWSPPAPPSPSANSSASSQES